MEILKQYGILAGMAILGLALLGYGLWGELRPEETVVEIVKGNTEEGKEIVVDVAGAVEKPGLYKLSSGSRIGNVIVQAGGLSAEADRNWVGQTLNLAQTVKDGEKIYIPSTNSSQATASLSAGKTGKININQAELAELDSLPGIGAVRAQAIIANRPYASPEELLSKAKIPEAVYAEIKDSLSVY